MRGSRYILLGLSFLLADATSVLADLPGVKQLPDDVCGNAMPGFEFHLEGWIVDAEYARSDAVIARSPRLPNGKPALRPSADIKDVLISFAAKAKIKAVICVGPAGPQVERVEWSADGETFYGSVEGAGTVAGSAAGMTMSADHQVFDRIRDRRGIAVWSIVDAKVTPKKTGEAVTRKMTLAGARAWPPIDEVDGVRVGWALIVLSRCLRFASCNQDQMDRVLIPTCVFHDTCHHAVGGRI